MSRTTPRRAPSGLRRLDALAELEDSRDVNDVVVQFLAYRSFDVEKVEKARKGPSGPDVENGSVGRMTDGRVDVEKVADANGGSFSFRSVRFTFDFFDFAPHRSLSRKSQPLLAGIACPESL